MSEQLTGFPMLDAFRALVCREVGEQLKRDGYHKQFEGAVTYVCEMPPTVDWTDMPDPLGMQPEMKSTHRLHLYCYVLGPSRQYEWKADSAAELFSKATEDFMGWVREAEREYDQESRT